MFVRMFVQMRGVGWHCLTIWFLTAGNFKFFSKGMLTSDDLAVSSVSTISAIDSQPLCESLLIW